MKYRAVGAGGGLGRPHSLVMSTPLRGPRGPRASPTNYNLSTATPPRGSRASPLIITFYSPEITFCKIDNAQLFSSSYNNQDT